MSTYIENQQTQARAQRPEATTRSVDEALNGLFSGKNSRNKKSNPLGTIVLVIVGIFFFAGGAIVDIYDEVSSDEPASAPLLSDSGSEVIAEDSGLQLQENSCIRVLTTSPELDEQYGSNACEVSFDRGLTVSSPAYMVNGEFYTRDIDEFIEGRNYEIIETVEINGQTAYRVDDGGDLETYELYIFWVRDQGIVTESGDQLEVIGLYMYGLDEENPYTFDENEADIASTVLRSFEIVAEN